MAWYRCVGGAGGSLKLRTASGRIATFSTNMVEAFKSLKSDINPVQDLHGYSKPWAGGCGKNKLNATGTNEYSTLVDGVYTVTSVPQAGYSWYIGWVDLKAGTYILSGGLNRYCRYYIKAGDEYYTCMGEDVSFTLTSDTTVSVSGVFTPEVTVGNKLKPMIRLASVSDASFEPYSNICPISGFSALNVTRTGVNLCYQVISGASISGGGQIVSEPSYAMGCAFLKKGVTYTVTTQEGQLVGGYFSSSPTIGSTAYDNTRFVLSNKTITPTKDCYIAFRMPSNYTIQPQVNIGSTALPYVAYNGQTATVNFGQTVYKGVADVTNGKVTLTHGIVDLGTLDWSAVGNMWFASLSGVKPIFDTTIPNAICTQYKAVPWVSGTSGREEGVFCFRPTHNQLAVRDTSYSSASDFKTAMSGVMLCYELATTTEITTTPENLTAIVGVNNVYGDTNGDTEVKYLYRE